jgi:hypothetical protein
LSEADWYDLMGILQSVTDTSWTQRDPLSDFNPLRPEHFTWRNCQLSIGLAIQQGLTNPMRILELIAAEADSLLRLYSDRLGRSLSRCEEAQEWHYANLLKVCQCAVDNVESLLQGTTGFASTFECDCGQHTSFSMEVRSIRNCDHSINEIKCGFQDLCMWTLSQM